MSVDKILGDVNKLTADFKAQRDALVESLKPNFHSIFISFLNKYEKVEHLSFTAYTPFFNDGDPCYFRVNDLEGFMEDGDEVGYSTHDSPALNKDFKELRKMFNEIPDDIIEDLFGDGVKVEINREGVEVSDYDHD